MASTGRGRRVFEVLRREAARLWWNPLRNLPVLDERLASPALPLRATPPRDVRPVMGKWYRFVRGVISEYLGVSVEKVLPWRRVVLGNKVQYPDYGEEIILDGMVVGHIVYDIAEKKWKYRPLYAAAERIVDERAGFFAIVDAPRLSRGYEVHWDRVIEKQLPERGRDEYVVVATANRRFYGLGVRSRRGRLYILKAWRSGPRDFLEGDPNWWDTVKANISVLEEKEREAVEFIRELRERYGLPFYVSFSGGKDSLVVLHLARLALGDVKVVFNDTGIEFPATVEYVHSLSERLGLDLEVADAGESFWRGFEAVGPPARDFRWCCKVVKFSPTARLVKRLFPGGAVALVGQRKYESSLRAKSPRVWRNKWFPKGIAASPILEWTALEIWLYIFWRRLLPNKLYYEGFDRLGCWLCPAAEMGEYELASRVEPRLYSEWIGKLRGYARLKGYPEEWVEYGLWRWLEPPGDILRYLGRSGRWYREARGASVRVEELGGGKTRIVVEDSRLPADPERLANIAYTACGETRVSGGEEGLVAEGCGREDLFRASIRAFYCAECLECANWCPRNAIYRREDGGIGVKTEACISCGVCNEKCPLAEYTLKARRASGAGDLSRR